MNYLRRMTLAIVVVFSFLFVAGGGGVAAEHHEWSPHYETGSGAYLDLSGGSEATVGSEFSYCHDCYGGGVAGVQSVGGVKINLGSAGMSMGVAPGPSNTVSELSLKHHQGSTANQKIPGGKIETWSSTSVEGSTRTNVDP